MPSPRAVLLAAAASLAGTVPGAGPTPPTPLPRAPAERVRFEPNRGQCDPAARWLARARGMAALLADDGALLLLDRGDGSGSPVRLRFEGAAARSFEPGGPALRGTSHYFQGNDPARWVRGVPRFPSVRVRGVLPGVDLHWRGEEGGNRLRFDVEFAAGVDPAGLAWRVEGGGAMVVDAGGRILLGTPSGALSFSRPLAWQDGPGGRRRLAARFALRGGGRAGFEVEGRDPALPLVVDPTLEYATYVGGSSEEDPMALALSPSGEIWMAGTTLSTNYPLKKAVDGYNDPPIFGATEGDGVLTRFTADGTDVLFSTYLGGMDRDSIRAIAFDASGRVLGAGGTKSADFPTKNAIQSAPGGGFDAFAFRIDPAGPALDWSTYVGGTGDDVARGAVADGSGGIFVVGETASAGFPVVSAMQATPGGGTDAFVLRATSSGTLAWSTFLGRAGEETGRAVALDGEGDLVVAGTTASSNFPIVGGAALGPGGGKDLFVARMPPTGAALAWSFRAGGSLDDVPHAVAPAPDGSIWLCGETRSADFPNANADQPHFEAGGTDSVIAQVAPAGDAFRYSTYLGGGYADAARGLAVDASGAAWVAGKTDSADFWTYRAWQPAFGGVSDAYVARFHRNGPLLFSTFVGGAYSEGASVLALDGDGCLLLGGRTNSPSLATSGAWQAYLGGLVDGFLQRIRMDPPTAPGNVVNALEGLDEARLSWVDTTGGVAFHDVERKVGAGGTFVLAGSAPPGVWAFSDAGLPRGESIAYRVAARDYGGRSAWVPAPSVATPPLPPETPTGLAVQLLGPTSARLTWQDNSAREDLVRVQRMEGGGAFVEVATAAEDAEAHDDTVRPDRSYRWRVVAGNTGGDSAPSNEAAAASPASVSFAVTRGSVLDSAEPGKDSLKVTCIFGPKTGTTPPVLSPAATGFTAWIMGRDHPPVIDVPAGDPGWKVGKTKSTWKTPKGAIPKAKVVVDNRKGKIAFSLSKAVLPVPPASPVLVAVDVGPADAASRSLPWRPGKPGQLKFP